MSNGIACLGEYRGTVIECRPADEFINATAMCQATGKRWAKYWANQQTQEFMAALNRQMGGGPNSDLGLIQVNHGGVSSGTWVHRRVAIHLAQWCSPEFAVWVTGQIEAIMTGRQVAHREHAEAAIANLTNSVSAIQQTVVGIVEEMVAMKAEQYEQNKKLILLYEQLAPAIKRIDEQTRCKRQPFSIEIQRQYVVVIQRFYSGNCPCCQSIQIIDNGKRIPHLSEMEHFFMRSLNNLEHGWLTCKTCNGKLARGRKLDGFWFKAMPAFQQFQRLLHQDGQLLLGFFEDIK